MPHPALVLPPDGVPGPSGPGPSPPAPVPPPAASGSGRVGPGSAPPAPSVWVGDAFGPLWLGRGSGCAVPVPGVGVELVAADVVFVTAAGVLDEFDGVATIGELPLGIVPEPLPVVVGLLSPGFVVVSTEVTPSDEPSVASVPQAVKTGKQHGASKAAAWTTVAETQWAGLAVSDIRGTFLGVLMTG